MNKPDDDKQWPQQFFHPRLKKKTFQFKLFQLQRKKSKPMAVYETARA